VEEAEHGGCAVELVEAAAEAGVGDGAAPGLANDGRAQEAGRVVGREAEENLFDKLVREHRRRGAAAWRRCHGARWVWFWFWMEETVEWFGSTRLSGWYFTTSIKTRILLEIHS
jgi:hypothetical protein